MTTIVLATRNPGKARELQALLDVPGCRLMDLASLGITEQIEETGDTFESNAAQKAEQALAWTGLPAIGDDSGLCVDALGGAPGVRSARFGGPGLTDAQRRQLLLDRMAAIPGPQRSARFEAVLAFACPGRETVLARGTLEGMIATEARGTAGFGYDPIFFVPALGATLAEVPAIVKNEISHRAVAARQLRQVLLDWLANQHAVGDASEQQTDADR